MFVLFKVSLVTLICLLSCTLGNCATGIGGLKMNQAGILVYEMWMKVVRKSLMLYRVEGDFFKSLWTLLRRGSKEKDGILPEQSKFSGSLQNLDHLGYSVDHFTVFCLVTWPLNDSEVRGDLTLILPALSRKCTKLALEQHDLHNKSSEVFMKTRSPPASVPIKGQVTEQRTVKWSIGSAISRQCFVF